MLEEYIVVDLEMTGLKPARDKILEIGAVHIKKGEPIATYQQLINPGVAIPEEIVRLTGITNEMARTGADIKKAMEEFVAFAGECPLVGHNIAYDYSFLKQNAVNQNLRFERKVLDTLKMARVLLEEPEKKTLDSLCAYFSIDRKEKHRALEDALATAKLFEVLQQRFGKENEDLFCPYILQYKVKKQGPITPRQKKYLKELINYHKIELSADLESMTKSEASRLTDRILFEYGRMPKC